MVRYLPAPTHVEVTVLGDTINMAARLSYFARGGTVWISKSMFGQLSSKERNRVEYGVRRRSEDGEDILVPQTYSRIFNLVDLDNPKNLKFRNIAAMPVTEVITVESSEVKRPLLPTLCRAAIWLCCASSHVP